MITETGTVIAKDSDHLWVETLRVSSCHSCAARAGCGQAVLGTLIDEGRQYNKNLLRVALSGNQRMDSTAVGDQVQVLIEEGAVLKMALMVYGLPLLFLLLSSIIAVAASLPDGLVTLAGLLGFTLSFMVVKKWTTRWDCDTRYHPHIDAQ